MTTFNKSEIFKAAWFRNKTAVARMKKETFGESLKKAWNEARAYNITVGENVRDNQTKGFWVASISGLDPKFGFSREFISEREVSSTSSKHRYFDITAKLLPGCIYELCEKGDRRFVVVEKGKLVQLTKEEIKSKF